MTERASLALTSLSMRAFLKGEIWDFSIKFDHSLIIPH